MALLGTIILVFLVAFRLLLPPVPRLAALSRTFGKRTTLVLFSVAMVGAVALIVLSRR